MISQDDGRDDFWDFGEADNLLPDDLTRALKTAAAKVNKSAKKTMRFATGSRDKTIRLWSLETGRTLFTFQVRCFLCT